MFKITKILLFCVMSVFLLDSCKTSKSVQSSRRSPSKTTKSKTYSKTNPPKKPTVPKKNVPESSTTAKKLSKSERKAQVDKVIKTAKTYLGTRYKYAGNTKSGIDCSGLTCAAYRSINVNLPRVAGDQAGVGEKISIDQLQPGDLLFFGPKKGSKSITHVGMVTTVKSKNEVIFIHSSTHGVMENNLFSEYYRGVYIKAVRPLTD